MAIPDSPLTRSEEYLNNIATGEGAIPDVPLTRIEQYLDYIAKNGGSGGGGSGGGVAFVDYTKSGAILTATKTAGEIFNLIMDGNTVVFRMKIGDLAVTMPCLYAENMSEYKFFVLLNNNHKAFMADTASDYPTIDIK